MLIIIIIRNHNIQKDDYQDCHDDFGGAQVSEYDNYEYDLKKEGVTEERTDGAYISVNDYYHDDHMMALMIIMMMITMVIMTELILR